MVTLRTAIITSALVIGFSDPSGLSQEIVAQPELDDAVVNVQQLQCPLAQRVDLAGCHRHVTRN
jgi:hypothetical protein